MIELTPEDIEAHRHRERIFVAIVRSRLLCATMRVERRRAEWTLARTRYLHRRYMRVVARRQYLLWRMNESVAPPRGAPVRDG